MTNKDFLRFTLQSSKSKVLRKKTTQKQSKHGPLNIVVGSGAI